MCRGTKYGKLAILEVAPEQLHRIELRRVCRQPLQMQSRVTRQQATDQLSLVAAAPIPHHDHASAQALEHLAQKTHHGLSGDVVPGVSVEVEPGPPAQRGDTQCGDDGDLVAMTAKGAQHGSFSFCCPGATHQGIKKEAAFVDQHEVSLLVPGFFSMRGQSWAIHCAMAASSRSSAFFTGFCGERCRCVSHSTR